MFLLSLERWWYLPRQTLILRIEYQCGGAKWIIMVGWYGHAGYIINLKICIKTIHTTLPLTNPIAMHVIFLLNVHLVLDWGVVVWCVVIFMNYSVPTVNCHTIAAAAVEVVFSIDQLTICDILLDFKKQHVSIPLNEVFGHNWLRPNQSCVDFNYLMICVYNYGKPSPFYFNFLFSQNNDKY